MFAKKFAIPVATAAVVLLGSVSSADAAEGGSPIERETAINGPGSVVNENSVDPATGALEVATTTRGGNQSGLLIPGLLGGTGGATTGGAIAGVQQDYNVDPGVYEVTIVFVGAQGSESHRGQASADVTLSVGASSSVVGAEGEGLVGASSPAPSSPNTITEVIEVPVDQTGELYIAANLYTTTFARGAGSSAEASGSVQSVSIDYRLVGEAAPETPAEPEQPATTVGPATPAEPAPPTTTVVPATPAEPETPTTTVAPPATEPPATEPPATENPAPETTAPAQTCILVICL